jgi:hypothetical protein
MRKALRRERVIGFAQARRSLDALLNLVKQGYTFRIKRRGRSDARLGATPSSPRSR